MSERAPLVERPERVAEAVRRVLEWSSWPLALGLTIWLAPRVAPWVQGLPEALREVAFWALAVGLVVVCILGTHTLRYRLQLGRRLRLGADAAWVSRQRLPGVLWFPVEDGDPPEPEAYFRVGYDQVMNLFRVRLRRTLPSLESIGLWYRGEDGRAREMWWYFGPEDADRVQAHLVEATGLEAKRLDYVEEAA